MKEILERHGGTVEKFIGDAVVAVFGVPTVHEDDALRALRAAVELRDALASITVSLEHDYGVLRASCKRLWPPKRPFSPGAAFPTARASRTGPSSRSSGRQAPRTSSPLHSWLGRR